MLRRLCKLDARWYVVIAISLMAFLASKGQGALVVKHTASICLVSCILDFMIMYVRDRKAVFPLSALVSGLIIASILAPTKLFYIAPACAILSKHLIHYSGRHIFNPAAFGLLASNVVWGLPLNWGFATNGAVIVGFGLLVAYKIKKLSLVFSFIGGMAALSILYSLIQHQVPLASIDVINPFFAFFMLPEPKTSPGSLKAKLVYGALTAVLAMACFIFLPQYDFVILALIMGNILGLSLRKVR